MNNENINKDEKLKEIKSKVYLENLKSDFFLIKVFNMMEKYKMLEIMKYNKKLQKRFNLNINNYKEYSQLYSSIEIELKLDKKFSGKFINIPDSMKDYYHIYFDNSKEETNKTCLNKNEKI